MDSKNLMMFSILFLILAGCTLSSVSGVNVPTNYKIYTGTNHYYADDRYYSDGEYIWMPKTAHFCNPVIREKYSGSQTKIQFYTYNNNGKYKWTDVRLSELTIYYKIVTPNKTYYTSRTVKYTKIPIYGMTKTISLKGPPGSHVIINHIKWTQVQRLWYGQ